MSKFPDDEDQEDQMKLGKEVEIDTKSFEVPYQEEVRQIERSTEIASVHHRITLLAILIPCLLGAMVLYAYIDIKEHVNRIQDVGSTEVEALSKDVVDKVSSVSEEHNKLAASLSNRIATLEASAVVARDRLEKQHKELQRTEGSKADKKSLAKIEEQTAEAAKALEAIKNAVDAQRLAVENLDKSFRAQMADLVQGVEAIKGERKDEASAIKRLSDTKMDKKAFDEFLKKERQSSESVVAPLNKELDVLKEGISRLQKQVNMLGRSIQLLEAEQTPSGKSAPQDLSTGGSKGAPGKIIEQEIAE